MTRTQRMAALSIAVSVVTLALKFAAYFLTHSVSLLSDAMESLVNVAAAIIAFIAVTIAAKPADEKHAYGHHKVEYFSSGLEGGLIMLAAMLIMIAAVQRLLQPVALQRLNLGLMVSLLATAINFAAARVMLRAAREVDSITIEADALHLMTDVWTSVGILAGLVVVMLAPAGFQVLDPLMALAVAARILVTGYGLVARSTQGLMDASLPAHEVREIEGVIRANLPEGADFHALRTRKAGSHRFVEFHLLVSGTQPLFESHDLCDRLEAAIEGALKNTSVNIHVEPRETHS